MCGAKKSSGFVGKSTKGAHWCVQLALISFWPWAQAAPPRTACLQHYFCASHLSHDFLHMCSPCAAPPCRKKITTFTEETFGLLLLEIWQETVKEECIAQMAGVGK